MRTGTSVSTGDGYALAALDGQLAGWSRRRGAWAVALHELVCFGIKQARACLFGGCMLALLGASQAMNRVGQRGGLAASNTALTVRVCSDAAS